MPENTDNKPRLDYRTAIIGTVPVIVTDFRVVENFSYQQIQTIRMDNNVIYQIPGRNLYVVIGLEFPDGYSINTGLRELHAMMFLAPVIPIYSPWLNDMVIATFDQYKGLAELMGVNTDVNIYALRRLSIRSVPSPYAAGVELEIMPLDISAARLKAQFLVDEEAARAKSDFIAHLFELYESMKQSDDPLAYLDGFTSIYNDYRRAVAGKVVDYLWQSELFKRWISIMYPEGEKSLLPVQGVRLKRQLGIWKQTPFANIIVHYLHFSEDVVSLRDEMHAYIEKLSSQVAKMVHDYVADYEQLNQVGAPARFKQVLSTLYNTIRGGIKTRIDTSLMDTIALGNQIREILFEVALRMDNGQRGKFTNLVHRLITLLSGPNLIVPEMMLEGESAIVTLSDFLTKFFIELGKKLDKDGYKIFVDLFANIIAERVAYWDLFSKVMRYETFDFGRYRMTPTRWEYTVTNKFVPLKVGDSMAPLLQHLGTDSPVFRVQYACGDGLAIRQLKQMRDDIDKAVQQINNIGSYFPWITRYVEPVLLSSTDGLVEFLGIQHAVLDSVSINPMEEAAMVSEVTCTFVTSDVTIFDYEQFEFADNVGANNLSCLLLFYALRKWYQAIFGKDLPPPGSTVISEQLLKEGEDISKLKIPFPLYDVMHEYNVLKRVGQFQPMLTEVENKNYFNFTLYQSNDDSVYALHDGIITGVQNNLVDGYIVRIKNGDFVTEYRNLLKLAEGIKPGERIEGGQLLGWARYSGTRYSAETVSDLLGTKMVHKGPYKYEVDVLFMYKNIPLDLEIYKQKGEATQAAQVTAPRDIYGYFWSHTSGDKITWAGHTYNVKNNPYVQGYVNSVLGGIPILEAVSNKILDEKAFYDVLIKLLMEKCMTCISSFDTSELEQKLAGSLGISPPSAVDRAGGIVPVLARPYIPERSLESVQLPPPALQPKVQSQPVEVSETTEVFSETEGKPMGSVQPSKQVPTVQVEHVLSTPEISVHEPTNLFNQLVAQYSSLLENDMRYFTNLPPSPTVDDNASPTAEEERHRKNSGLWEHVKGHFEQLITQIGDVVPLVGGKWPEIFKGYLDAVRADHKKLEEGGFYRWVVLDAYRADLDDSYMMYYDLWNEWKEDKEKHLSMLKVRHAGLVGLVRNLLALGRHSTKRDFWNGVTERFESRLSFFNQAVDQLADKYGDMSDEVIQFYMDILAEEEQHLLAMEGAFENQLKLEEKKDALDKAQLPGGDITEDLDIAQLKKRYNEVITYERDLLEAAQDLKNPFWKKALTDFKQRIDEYDRKLRNADPVTISSIYKNAIATESSLLEEYKKRYEKDRGSADYMKPPMPKHLATTQVPKTTPVESKYEAELTITPEETEMWREILDFMADRYIGGNRFKDIDLVNQIDIADIDGSFNNILSVIADQWQYAEIKPLTAIVVHVTAGHPAGESYIDGPGMFKRPFYLDGADEKARRKGYGKNNIYHMLIGNGFIKDSSGHIKGYDTQYDGKVMVCRPLTQVATHVANANHVSIGIAWVGMPFMQVSNKCGRSILDFFTIQTATPYPYLHFWEKVIDTAIKILLARHQPITYNMLLEEAYRILDRRGWIEKPRGCGHAEVVAFTEDFLKEVAAYDFTHYGKYGGVISWDGWGPLLSAGALEVPSNAVAVNERKSGVVVVRGSNGYRLGVLYGMSPLAWNNLVKVVGVLRMLFTKALGREIIVSGHSELYGFGPFGQGHRGKVCPGFNLRGHSRCGNGRDLVKEACKMKAYLPDLGERLWLSADAMRYWERYFKAVIRSIAQT